MELMISTDFYLQLIFILSPVLPETGVHTTRVCQIARGKIMFCFMPILCLFIWYLCWFSLIFLARCPCKRVLTQLYYYCSLVSRLWLSCIGLACEQALLNHEYFIGECFSQSSLQIFDVYHAEVNISFFMFTERRLVRNYVYITTANLFCMHYIARPAAESKPACYVFGFCLLFIMF